MEQRQARLIDLKDWERSGGGGNGWSYFNRKDSSIMLKLNKEEIQEEISYREFSVSATLYEMGVSCPRVFDFVTDGTRFGMTVERIRGKKSYVRMIADNPDLLEPLAKDFAVRSKEFHSIRCDTTKFESKKERCRRLFASCREYYGSRWGSRELKQKIDSVIMIKAALAITNRPRSAKVYLPLLRGQKFKFATIMRVVDILVRRFN